MKRLTLAVATLLLGVAGCGSEAADRRSPAQQVALTVFAASSLSSAFTEIGDEFEAVHPGVTVRFNFAGSSDLVAQIQQGAPADVFASADARTMDIAVTANVLDGNPGDFATNTLEIATPTGNPANINGVKDLIRPGVKVVLCAAQVPCGAAAQKIQDASGIDIKPVSEEQSVTDVLGKVLSGEADAGLVYVTDVKSAGDKVIGIPFPESAHAKNTYPIAAVKGSVGDGLPEAFIAYVMSAEGQSVLAAAGFTRP